MNVYMLTLRSKVDGKESESVFFILKLTSERFSKQLLVRQYFRLRGERRANNSYQPSIYPFQNYPHFEFKHRVRITPSHLYPLRKSFTSTRYILIELGFKSMAQEWFEALVSQGTPHEMVVLFCGRTLVCLAVKHNKLV